MRGLGMNEEHAFVRFERADPCNCDSILEACPKVLDILVYSLGDVRRALDEYPCMHLKKLAPNLAPPTR